MSQHAAAHEKSKGLTRVFRTFSTNPMPKERRPIGSSVLRNFRRRLASMTKHCLFVPITANTRFLCSEVMSLLAT